MMATTKYEGAAAADARSAPLIRIVAASRRFQVGQRNVDALVAVTLVVAATDFLAVVGPSGSGKSTLLNVIGGLDRPTSGAVYFEERELNRFSSDQLASYRSETIGFVFQAFRLLPELTAQENVGLPVLFAKHPQREADRRATRWLERVGLGDRLTHRPGQLSAGEQQRVALARALVNEPRILLADEPTASLDAAAAAALLLLINELRTEHHLTVIVATHNAELAAHATRICHLRHGRVVAE